MLLSSSPPFQIGSQLLKILLSSNPPRIILLIVLIASMLPGGGGGGGGGGKTVGFADRISHVARTLLHLSFQIFFIL